MPATSCAALLAATGRGAAAPRVLNCASGLTQLRLRLQRLFAALDGEAGPEISTQGRTRLGIELLGALGKVLRSAQDSPPLSSYRLRQRIVERARTHVLTRSWESITIADVCDRVGVSRRTLQTCFREVLDTNPGHYLRAIRLDRVRRELRGAARTVQIKDVATRWGFWHLSHFANEYRAMFGELPSETLRRSAAGRNLGAPGASTAAGVAAVGGAPGAPALRTA